MTSVRDDPLYDEHIKYLARQAHAIGVPAHEVDDIVQDTLLKAIELMPTFRGDAKKTTWLYKILQNVWRNGNRRISRRLRKHHNYEAQYRASEPARVEHSEFDAELGLAIRELGDFVDSLSPEEREAFVARAIRGFGRSEAAALLGVEPAVLDRRLGSANVRFDDHFDRSGKSSARRSRHGILAWLPPTLKGWTSSGAGQLLSVLACIIAGLWLIAATTPDTRRSLERHVHKSVTTQQQARVAASEPTMPPISPTSPTSPIVVELDDRIHGGKRSRTSDSTSMPVDDTQHLAHGRELRYEHRLEEALAHIRAIDHKGPLARERWGNEVGILCEMQRFDEADAASEQWLAAFPDDFAVVNRSCVATQPHTN